jgi:topoisomerase IA-like protein
MTKHPAGREPELLTITEAAELLRAPVATWAPARAASASAAAFSTAPTSSAAGSTPSTARSPPARESGGEPAPPSAHSPG